MAKIIKRIEIVHEIDEETKETDCVRRATNVTHLEAMGMLLYEALSVFKASRALDKPESEVRPDEPTQ